MLATDSLMHTMVLLSMEMQLSHFLIHHIYLKGFGITCWLRIRRKIIAKWDHILQFYELDSSDDVRMCPKLTDLHVFPNKINKMKVPSILKFCVGKLEYSCVEFLNGVCKNFLDLFICSIIYHQKRCTQKYFKLIL